LSLRIRLFIVLSVILAGAAAVIWLGIKPSYEDAILEERLTLITEYQQQRIRESDMQLYFWLKVSTELQMQVLKEPQSIELTFNNYVRLFPDLQGFRLTEVLSNEFVEMRTSVVDEIPNYDTLERHKFFISEAQFLSAGWTESRRQFFITQEFDYQGNRYRLTSLFDSRRIIETMTQNVLREDAFTLIWLPDGSNLGSVIRELPKPEQLSITSYNRVIHDGRRYLAVSTTFMSIPVMHSIYIDISILQNQVSALFSQSLIMLIIAFMALGAGGHLLISRVQRPINNFLEDVAPFANYNFDRPFRIADLPELASVTERMETIREKLLHYKRINVEQVIVQEQRNRMLMTYATEMVGQYDENGKMFFINEQFADLIEELNLDLSMLRLKDFLDSPMVVVKERTADVTGKDHLVLSSQKIDLEIQINDEKMYYYEMHLTDITDHQHNHLGGLLLLNDMTRSREIEKMRTEMINIIVHELQNPVSAGLGLTSYLLEEEDIPKEEQEEVLGMVKKSMTTLSNMINRFLAVSRLESTNIKIDKHPVDLNTIVRPVVDSFRTQLLERDIQIILNEETTPLVDGSFELLEDMMRNLISNAIKYGDDKRTIDVNLWSNGDSVLFSVTDRGFGIPEEFHDKIFQKFYRIKAYNRQKGTGLGLPYVKEIVNKHDGEIKIESNPEIGTRFTVSIPVKETELELS
jgi:signal transduction histidine kinase